MVDVFQGPRSMNDEIPSYVKSKDGALQSSSGPLVRQVQDSERDSSRAESTQLIAIASTFTVELLRRPLTFWMETLDISADIAIAPYAQVMQELLNPEGLLSQNNRGFNILLIRLGDWIRDRLEESAEQNLDHIRRMKSDVVTAMGLFRARTSAPILILFCPPSSSLPVMFHRPLEEVQRDLIARLDSLGHVYCLSHADLVRLYPVIGYEDARADRIGHIPYTNEYFVAIATLLARRIAALLKPQYKVIAVDCDNTLWKGACGDEGGEGVDLTPAHIRLQKMLVRQHDAGVLLCLCSKNNAIDVEAVFRSRPEMPLREGHLICSRVNWNAKSENLQSISQELGLSLESFIFIDDSPMECAEVRAHCPSVLTLRLPEDQEGISHFLDHVWALDRIGVTKEAKRRTTLYKQNRARHKALEQAPNLEQFLASLKLKVHVSPMHSGQLPRVAELIQRTNQFNLTTIRRSATDIEVLWRSGDIQSLVVAVRDRFGDYGLVGALFFRREPSSIDVETFVLSCRVLGRGVEHRIVNELGRIARKERLPNVVLTYRQTPRNTPALAFLEKSFRQFRKFLKGNGEDAAEIVFTIPVEYAENLGNEPVAARVGNEGVKRTTITSTPQSISSTRWHQEAYRLSHIYDIVQEINRSRPIVRGGRGEYVAPRTSTEAAIAAIWAEVLGVQQVGVRDNFLAMGGDSLQVVQAIAKTGSVLGVELSVYEFFEGPTVEEVANKLAAAPEYGLPIERKDRTRPVPLSWSQRRLWFIDQLEDGSAAYHIPLSIQLCGELDRAALQGVLDTLITRHEALRTVFKKADGEPVQEIASEAHFALKFVDLSVQGAREREASVRRESREEAAAPFDLSAGPVIRGRLLQLTDDEHILLVTMHHIVSDGWSVGVLIRELGVLYEAYCKGQPDPLPPLPIQYADYAQWQRRWLTGRKLQEQLRYWGEHLQGAPELLELPTDRPRPPIQSYRGGSVCVSLGPNLTASLKGISRRLNLTLAMTLYAAWTIVLSRLSGQGDIVVGVPIANRRRTELEGLIGFFVNTLAVRVRLDDDPRVTDLLRRVRRIMLGAYAQQDTPFEQVVEAVRPARSLSHSPIFQVMFVLLPASRGVLQLPGLTLVEQEVPLHTARFDLVLSLQESTDGVFGNLNYSSDLFDAATIETWVGWLKNVLSGMVRQSHVRVSRLPLMSEAERRQVIEVFNETQTAYPHEKLIHQLFEEQVERVPHAVAVVYKGQSLTYDECNGKANQLARYLRTKGVGPDRLVGVFVERSLEMVVGLLGILKAGGAYVTLDPSYPAERLRYLLEDAAPRVLLTQERLRERLPDAPAEVIALDDDWNEIAKGLTSNLDSRALKLRSGHLAYVIYTSGSTGKPKGVMVEHRNVISLWQGLEHIYCQSIRCQRIGVNASFNFDASVKQFVQLLSGRTIVVVPQESRWDASTFLSFIYEHRIDGIDCTPWQLRSWLSAGLLEKTNRYQLRMALTGGEPIDAELWRSLAQCSETDFYNVYGPTEGTVDTTFARLRCDTTAPHIGRPMENRCVYILDRYGQPVPIGVKGEMYIGGAGVARGYLNRPGLTAERFLPDTFSADPKARMYKTGDLGRWRSDGTIEYLGRNDDQVKIRGFRIELGEIEAQLARHAQVSEAVVVAREDIARERRLVAYVTRRGQRDPTVEDLRSYLKAALPEYMVPSVFVILENLPLTLNGKPDRRALPTPELGAYASQEYEAPQGDIEEALSGIWQKLLRVERVGRQDNFFELGGHSLLATQVITHISDVLDVDLPLRVMFEKPTIEGLSNCIVQEIAAEVSMEAP